MYLLYSSWLSLAGVTLHGCSQSQAAKAVILYELELETLFILFICLFYVELHAYLCTKCMTEAHRAQKALGFLELELQ